MENILLGPSISKHDKPKKLMVMLHGYGDNAANFIHLAEPLDQDEWGMHYVALNAPSIMPGNPMCYQSVSYTHIRAHETEDDLVCRLLLE